MTLRTTTSLTAPASIPGVRRQVGPAVTCQLPRKLPRFGATNMGIGLMAYHMNQAGFHEEAEALVRNFQIRTGMPVEETEDAA